MITDTQRLNFLITTAQLQCDFDCNYHIVLIVKGKTHCFDGKDPIKVIDDAMMFWMSKNAVI